MEALEGVPADLLIHCAACNQLLGPAKALRLHRAGATSMLSFAVLEECEFEYADTEDFEVLTVDELIAEAAFDRERLLERLLALESQPGLLSADGHDVAPTVTASLKLIIAEIDFILKTLDRKGGA